MQRIISNSLLPDMGIHSIFRHDIYDAHPEDPNPAVFFLPGTGGTKNGIPFSVMSKTEDRIEACARLYVFSALEKQGGTEG